MSEEKAIGYAYDSMGQQSSLDKQKKEIEEYCKEHGIELQSVHETSLMLGAKKHETFKEFLESQDAEDITVVVSQIDRLASDFDSFEEIADTLKKKNVTVLSTKEGENQYYSEVLAKKGVPNKIISQVPFGYEMKDGELVQQQGEAKVVAWVFEKTLEYSDNPPEILTEYVREQLEAKYDAKDVTDEFVLEQSKLRVKEYLAIELNTRLGTYREIGCAMEQDKVKEMFELPLTDDDIKIIKAKLRNQLVVEKNQSHRGPAIYCRVGNKER